MTVNSDPPTADELPIFDFRAISLSRSSGEQLAKIYEAVQANADSSRSVLRNLIVENCFDPRRGIYVPITDDVKLIGKLPIISEKIARLGIHKSPIFPFGAALFTNALVIPNGYGTGKFDPKDAPAPKTRLTNIGFLVVTLEYDCQTVAEFEELLSWTRGRRGDGDTTTSAFAEVDRELGKLSDYRGYTIVFSGNRSLHFHCLFSTDHLKNAPSDAPADLRRSSFRDCSALLENAHRIYWDHVDTVFKSVLNPSIPSDPQLRQATQWRRSPWGIRILDEDSKFLGLPKGTKVPQIVIRERIRTRAARGANDYLVAPSFSVASPIPSTKDSPRRNHKIVGGDAFRLVPLLQEECRMEWGGEYPKPVVISQQHGDWIIKFKNHTGDKNPATIVIGQHRRLMIKGRHEFGDQQFYLPDHMTANDLVDYLLHRTGQTPTNPSPEQSNQRQPNTLDTINYRLPGFHDYSELLRRQFREPLSDKPIQELKDRYRGKLWHQFFSSRDFSDKIVIISGEGIGKTSTLLPLLSYEAQDDNTISEAHGIERFAGFAFRSHQQAERKADEFRAKGYPVLVWRSFWEHYREACAAQQQTAIARDEFSDTSPKSVLLQITKDQPGVFERLEHVRKNLWSPTAKFSAYSTILVMTHRAVQTWDTGILTRAWHHPDFDPFAPFDEHLVLRDKIKLSRVVLDDPEADDFFYVLPESTFEFLHRQQERHPDWRNRRRNEQLSIYRRLKENKELPGNLFAEFDNFDELMRLDLTILDMVAVDYDKIPFGYDRTISGIYRTTHGDKYYISSKPWLFSGGRHWTVLTTETLVADVIVGVTNQYRAKGGESKLPFRVPLDDMPGIYPIKIPTFLDRRAQKREIKALAQEITSSNRNAMVISDMVGDVPGVMTFQSMKGINELAANDVYIVVTCLSPPKYAELNVIGRWLGIPNIIQNYYQDQINQAVGRNTGFRQSRARETKTALVASRRLWRSVLSRLSDMAPRVQLYEIAGKPW